MKMFEKLMNQIKENKASVVFALLTVLVFTVGVQLV